jgi:hypothetical protein
MSPLNIFRWNTLTFVILLVVIVLAVRYLRQIGIMRQPRVTFKQLFGWAFGAISSQKDGFTIKSAPAVWRGAWHDLFPTMPAIIGRPSIEGLRDRGTPETSHTIDLPLSNPTSCRNTCAVGRCSKTGQQCLADIDCPGCNPYAAADTPFDVGAKSVPAANDAGKLTAGVTPTYSSLTTDIGSRAAVFNTDALGTPPPKGMLDMGGAWRSQFDAAQELYDAKYRPKPGQYAFMPSYPEQPTTTGMFVNSEPLAANF